MPSEYLEPLLAYLCIDTLIKGQNNLPIQVWDLLRICMEKCWNIFYRLMHQFGEILRHHSDRTMCIVFSVEGQKYRQAMPEYE